MKTFTFVDGKIIDGIKVSDLSNSRSGFLLGERGGSSGKTVALQMDKFHPAEVLEDGRVHDCYLKNVNRDRDERPYFVVAADWSRKNNSVIVRVATDSFRRPTCSGYVSSQTKHWTIATGLTPVGRKPCEDALVALRPGEHICVQLSDERQYTVCYLNGAVTAEQGWPALDEGLTKESEAPTPAAKTAEVIAPVPDAKDELELLLQNALAQEPEKLAAEVHGRNSKQARRNWQRRNPVVCTA